MKIIISLSLTYFKLLYHKADYALIIDYYSFIVGIVVIPLIVSSIISYRNQEII